MAISSLVYAELCYGISKSVRLKESSAKLTQFISPLIIVDFNDAAAKYYGDIRDRLENTGSVIGAMDMLIAAHALSLQVPLVTNNTKEFMRVPNLEVENWLE